MSRINHFLFIAPWAFGKLAHLACEEGDFGCIQLLAKSCNQFVKFFFVDFREALLRVGLSLVPENALEDPDLHGDLRSFNGVVPRMALGLTVVTAWFPARNRRTAGSARDQSYGYFRVVFCDADAKCSPKTRACKRFVEMEGSDGGCPFVLFSQRKHSRMRFLVLSFHFSASGHVGLPYKQV